VILCVDPDETDRAATRAALADAGFDTLGRESLAAARDAFDGATVDCLVTEYDLGDGTGLDLVREVRSVSPDTACVLFTDVSLDDVDTAAFGGAVAEYLRKDAPDARTELAALVDHSLSFLSQTAYPLPADEGARLAALGRYADDPTGLDEALDRLTTLAAGAFGVDGAFVGLVDAHHERYVSCHGASLDTAPREDTICTYAILDEGVTVVEDVPADPRFETNGFVADAGIGFYAGAPLLTDDGQAIGTFCLVDGEPRSLDGDATNRLRLFADEAMDQLELRRRLGDAGEART
jgi:GAF domain-containing protein